MLQKEDEPVSQHNYLICKFKPQCWHLPRPGTRYKGGYPLHFEKKIRKLLGTENILHVFSGSSKMGLTVDIKPENKPIMVADAHCLPFKDNTFDAVVADPPYSDDYAKDLYKTPKLKPTAIIKELVRVLKPDGVLVWYHLYPIPRPEGCKYLGIITIVTRIYHKPRVVTVFRKDGTSRPRTISLDSYISG